MRKNILVMALIIAGAFSVSSVAQNKDANNCPKKECTASKECKKASCAFDNLNLSDAQKTQIKSLNEQMRDSRKDLRNQKQENAKELKAGREAAKTKYNDGLKKILTPEQYTKYLENQLNSMGDRYNQKKGNDCKKGKQCSDAKGNCPKNKK